MSSLRERNKALLAKIETTLGTDASPVAADAVAIEDLRFEPNVNQVQTNESTGSLDTSPPIVGGMKGRMTFTTLVRGSGVPETAPPFGKLLTACSLKELLTSSAVPASPEACAAGSTTSATLAAGASATAQAYRGMPVEISGASGAPDGIYPISNYTTGKVATLAAATGAAVSASADYQILKNSLYKPTSDPADAESLTLYAYKDGKLIKMVGCRGTASLELAAGGLGRLKFEFMGLFVSETDAAVPSGIATPSVVPPTWKGGKFQIDRSPFALNTLQLGFGVQLTMPGNPNTSEGFDYAVGVSRDMSGSIDPLDTLVATADTMNDFRNGTRRIILAQWGTVAGNRFMLTVPTGQYTQLGDQEREGLAVRQLGFKAVGDDAGAFLCQF